jgi:multiple sugar transport system permease protein
MYSSSVAIILAGVVLALLPTLLLYIFSQRYLVEGIASSGIKG